MTNQAGKFPPTTRELTSGELDSVSGGHTFVPPETLGQSLQRDPGRTVALAGDVAAIPGNVAGNAGTPGGGLLGLG